MSKRELDQVKQHAREHTSPYASFEDRMSDAICYTSLTLGQYWPDADARENVALTSTVLALSVVTAAAEEAKLARKEADHLMDAFLHHPGHSLW
jgi:hypothetical protein